jgi:hypothetical protein
MEAVADDLVDMAAVRLGSWRQEAVAADLVYEAVAPNLVREAAVVDLVHLVQKATAAG